MALSFELVTGSDVTLSRGDLHVQRKFRATDTIPQTDSGDYFDLISDAAIAWIRVNAPYYQTPYGLLHWQSIQVLERFYALNYEINVTYGPQNHQAGAYTISVDGTGGTAHVTSGTVVSAWGPNAPTDAADVSPLIGVVNGEPTGVDIPVEKVMVSVQFRHPGGFLSAYYVKSIAALVGYPNADYFLSYEPGEVMFLGPRFTQTSCEASAQYDFAISRNRANFIVGGITIGAKTGWDVLHPVLKYEEKDDKVIPTVDYYVISRPAGRGWVPYASVFGWGGT